jgi:hypothetical protein
MFNYLWLWTSTRIHGGFRRRTHDIDIGLSSRCRHGKPGEFLKLDRRLLQATLRLNTMSHLDIATSAEAR